MDRISDMNLGSKVHDRLISLLKDQSPKLDCSHCGKALKPRSLKRLFSDRTIRCSKCNEKNEVSLDGVRKMIDAIKQL